MFLFFLFFSLFWGSLISYVILFYVEECIIFSFSHCLMFVMDTVRVVLAWSREIVELKVILSLRYL